MSDRTILVPVDGASNIKLEALDFETLATAHSAATASPTAEHDGLACNATGEEFDWFDEAIGAMPAGLRNAAVVAPVARGASGGLVGPDNTLLEAGDRRLTLAYTQPFGDEVDDVFREIAGSREAFFEETGSIRDLPGSLTLLKRFVFEQRTRPALVAAAAGFAHYGALLGGHFLGGDYLEAIRQAGNEHSYWMCHSGTRNVRAEPGTPSAAAGRVEAFGRLVPSAPTVCYRPLGTMPAAQADALGLDRPPVVIPGGHDTCLSHLPILSTFYQAFPAAAGKPVLHVEAGTWTMIALVAGRVELPADGYRRDVLIQGTVDGGAVVTARYGGGADFTHGMALARSRGAGFEPADDHARLGRLLAAADCFVLPNGAPANRGTGPFPDASGRIVNEPAFFADPIDAYLATNLMTAMTTACQVEGICPDASVPIVLTAGGSKDPLFATLLATLTARAVYAMFDGTGQAVTETTTLGAAIAGKAACLGVHPHDVDTTALGVRFRRIEGLSAALSAALEAYRARWRELVDADVSR